MPKSSNPAADFDAASWRRRLEAAVAEDAPAAPLDTRQVPQALRPAAVLIAVEDASAPHIVFTQRSRALRHHPGQISFPGGSIEARDTGPADAALRECEEEIGLAREAVTLLGELPRYSTVTGFEIRPFVGWVDAAQTLVPDGVEVERIFTVPLAYAMDPANYRSERYLRDGREYQVVAIDFEGHHIWGATAAMLMGLAQQIAIVTDERKDIPSANERK